jgi:hypothetical protein
MRSLFLIFAVLPMLNSCATFGEGKRTIQVVETKSGLPLSDGTIAWRHHSIIPHFPVPDSPKFVRLDSKGKSTETFSFSDGVFYLGPFDEDGSCITDTSAWIDGSVMKTGGHAALRSFKLGKDGTTRASADGTIHMNSKYKLTITKQGEQVSEPDS